jgi:hypothetical protein
MKRFISLIVLLSLISNATNATTRRVLFIGNSYIFTNNMPDILSQLAASLGDTLIYDQSTPGGYTLQAHSTDANTLAKIYAQQWDVVIIQEQSQRPSFPPSQVATDTYPYAHFLDSLVHDNNACSETMFMMTWGYKNGDPMNCGGYPIVCTYQGMQQRLRESYMEMAQDNNANCAPVGAAWKVTRDSFPGIELYSGDNSHPVVAGSYLEACVLYASIFHRAPNLSTYYSTLADTVATKLQNVATHVVLDSLEQWQQHGNYVYSGFGLSINDKTITLQNNSQRATSYFWDLGDLNTDNATNPAPHTYANYGAYTVTLTASNSCLSETKKQNINLVPVSVAGVNKGAGNISVYTQPSGRTTILIEGDCDQLEVYNVSGQNVWTSKKTERKIELDLIPGLYLVIGTVQGRSELHKFNVN